MNKWRLSVAAAALVFGLNAGVRDWSSQADALRTIVLAKACSPQEGQARRDALGALLQGAAAYAQTLPGDLNAPPPLIAGLGDAHFPVTTASPQAQAYFDQGLRMTFNFNHAEAIRAFKEAQRIDPNCAMCFWGEAFALGPNINAPMDPNDNAAAYAAARAAHGRKGRAAPLEQALIDAIQSRYARTAPENRAALDGVFADASARVADRFPNDDLAQIIAAEAAMDTQPWDYWQSNGREPKGRMAAAIARIERVLARSPDNAGANHLYIHLVEASTNPWRAERAAERLARATTRAGHLVHMPAHIYYRVGRFRDSMQANVAASAADESYIRIANASPIYRYGYYPHNLHFVLTSAAMGGDGRTALQYADRLDEALPVEMAAGIAISQPVKAAPWFARAQFATPESILAASPPPEGVALVTGAWRYARAIAQVRSGRLNEARAEARMIENLMRTGDFGTLNAAGVPARDVLDVYRRIALARAFMAERAYPAAIAELEAALEVNRRIPYMEPPYIYYPVRRTLGAAYLLSGQPARAEMEFLQTLIESPNDAYAYWGISEARRARGDRTGAMAARHLFNGAYIGPRGGLRLEHL